MFCVFVSLVDFRIIDPTKPLVHYFGATSALKKALLGFTTLEEIESKTATEWILDQD